MSPGAKVFLTLAGVGTVLGVVLLAASKNASAAPGKAPPQVPGDNSPPDVIVPPPGGGEVPQTPSMPSLPLPSLPLPPLQPGPLPPLQPAPTPPAQPSPGATTYSLPNPLGGPPLGTFNPDTGNVFGPGGVVIGRFDPNTGIFTPTIGPQLQIPGFGPQGGQPTPFPEPSIPPPPGPMPAPIPPFVLPEPVPVPQPSTEPPAQPAPVSTVTEETAAMVSTLLRAEASAGWNKIDPTVAVFQKARGLKVDSKYGPQTALMAAKEIGTLPILRFWPLGSTKAKLLASYKASLLALANASPDPVRAQQLRLSAAREDGRAYSTKGGLPALPADMRIGLAQVA